MLGQKLRLKWKNIRLIFRLSTMYMSKHLNNDEMDNSRDSPRLHDGEMPSKKPRLDLNNEGDERRQVSQHMRKKTHPPQLKSINLVD